MGKFVLGNSRDSPVMETGPPEAKTRIERNTDMNNSCAIGSVSRQISETAERIDHLSMDIEQMEQSNRPDLLETYEDIMLSELEQLQRLVLSLTSIVAGSLESEEKKDAESNTDEGEASAFIEGELNDKVEVAEPTGEKA